jgi:hypothetical protein
MVLGSHVVFGDYGFWLPNDPRGSWSEFVGAIDLYQFDSATKTSVRRSVATKSHDGFATIRSEVRVNAAYGQILRYSSTRSGAGIRWIYPTVRLNRMGVRSVTGSCAFGDCASSAGSREECRAIKIGSHRALSRRGYPVKEGLRPQRWRFVTPYV